MCVRLSACCLALAAGRGQEIESEVGEQRRKETETKTKDAVCGLRREFRDIFTIFCLIFFSVIDTFVCACVCVRTPVTDPHTHTHLFT